MVAPWVKPDAEGAPRYRLPGRPGQPLPYLGYAPGAYLGRVVDQLLKESGTAIHLDRVYETDMAEGLKVMALEGHGIAFLPQSAVRKEVRARTLVSALPPEIDSLEATMEIRAYRERPVPRRAGKTRRARRPGRGRRFAADKSTVDALWAYLVGTQPADLTGRFLCSAQIYDGRCMPTAAMGIGAARRGTLTVSALSAVAQGPSSTPSRVLFLKHRLRAQRLLSAWRSPMKLSVTHRPGTAAHSAWPPPVHSAPGWSGYAQNRECLEFRRISLSQQEFSI